MRVQRHHLPPLLQKNEVLFGHDGTKGLIAIEREDNVVLFIRDLKVKTKKRNAAAPRLSRTANPKLRSWN